MSTITVGEVDVVLEDTHAGTRLFRAIIPGRYSMVGWEDQPDLVLIKDISLHES